MNKTWLIIKREYLTRVRNKTFLLSTFLTPLLFIGVIATIVVITVKNSDQEIVAVVDGSGIFTSPADSNKSVKFVVDPTVDTSNFSSKGYSAILYSPKTGVNKGDNWKIYSKKNFGVISSDQVDQKLSQQLEKDLFLRYGVDAARVDSIRNLARSITAEPAILEQGESEKRGNSGIAYGVGYAAAFLIYITLFIYGAMVMRGVMEEKTTRIAEVIISSVKPFQLMMGKIIGIGAVGLTQLVLWIILIFLISTAAFTFLPHDILQQVKDIQSNPGVMTSNPGQFSAAAKGLANLTNLNWPLIVGFFLFYFIGGYLFYSALFAAVGSVINEDPQEAQSLMFPIMMPIVFGFIIMSTNIDKPDSPVMVWASIIPFTSPIVMMGRLASSPPFWQIAVSMLSLVGGFILTTWLAGKIYRTGILLYGKKPSWKE